MPSSDYTTTGGGLKLKGVKDAGIDKKRKKKRKVVDDAASKETSSGGAVATKEGDLTADDGSLEDAGPLTKNGRDEQEGTSLARRSESREESSGKTETELRHQEIRRKRLDERLKREGVKTHKERVQELNTYLSGLSEHHDMPRIGPG